MSFLATFYAPKKINKKIINFWFLAHFETSGIWWSVWPDSVRPVYQLEVSGEGPGGWVALVGSHGCWVWQQQVGLCLLTSQGVWVTIPSSWKKHKSMTRLTTTKRLPPPKKNYWLILPFVWRLNSPAKLWIKHIYLNLNRRGSPVDRRPFAMQLHQYAKSTHPTK